MSKSTDSLKILLYGLVVYDLLDTLRSKLSTPATLNRLKENAPSEVLAEHMLDADVVIALTYRQMPPRRTSVWCRFQAPA